MSLKAYDGMMSRKGFHYVQEKIKEHMGEFFEASKEKRLEYYAEIITRNADSKYRLDDLLLCDCDSTETKNSMKNLLDCNSSILSTIIRGSSILDNTPYLNSCSSMLQLTIEDIGNKLLIFPYITVRKHKEILLKFLDDWYAQDQVDPDEDVPSAEWSERVSDWWKFNETRGLSQKIIIFDPYHHSDNFTNQLRDSYDRDNRFIDDILSRIPSDEKRKISIGYRRLFDEVYKKRSIGKEMNTALAINISNELRADDSKLVREYLKDNPMELTKIDEEYLKSNWNNEP